MPPKEQFLVVRTTTVFKQDTISSRLLPDKDKFIARVGTRFPLLWHVPAPGKHIKCTFGKEFGEAVRNTWYAFGEHVYLEIFNPEGDEEEKEVIEDRPGLIKLPGFSSDFYLSDPILPNGDFTWGEATKHGQRIPTTKAIVENILKMADVMQEIRELFENQPIIVTSWYRDAVTNKRVGGASRSTHLTGGAVDFKVKDVPPHIVQKVLEEWWGSRGGLASANTFTHIDNRGYRARWSYGV